MDKKLARIYDSARDQERTQVREFIEDIKAGIANHFLLNLFAPKGFGKTAFLRLIWKDYERILPASLVRVGDFCGENDEACALSGLLIQIIRDLCDRLPSRIVNLPSGYESLTNEEHLAELIRGLGLSAQEFEKVTLLLLDDYDLMPEAQTRWFQKNILSPLARTRKTAIILTSEAELRFTESLDLRMRLKSRELTSLNPEAIARALPGYGERIADEIYLITGGLPVLTQEFIKQLQASQVATAADFQAQAQELVRKYYQTHVEREVLASLAPDIRETLLVLALLRRFDVRVLKGILPKLLPDSYQDYGTADYLGLVSRLQSWVQWRRQGGYTLNPAFGMMLQGYVLTEEPNLYKKVNRAAVALYDEWLEEEYRGHYLIELLYHKLALYRLEKGHDLFSRLGIQDEMSQAKVSNQLLEYLTGNGGRCIQEADLDALRNSLHQDPDLKIYISEDVDRAIQGLINQRIKEAQKENSK